jgi:hypothetical protein
MSVKDLLKQKFGKLTVLCRSQKNKWGKRHWLCKCDCGNEKIITGYNLLMGYTKSCGCLGGVDLIGKTFNKLTVIKLLSKTDKICHDRYWLCKCDCGNETKVRQSHLVNENIKSCGCEQFQTGSKHPCWTGFGEFSGTFFRTIEHGAKIRNLEFSITKEYIWKLFINQNKRCALTGLALWFSKFSGGNDGNASLDRINSSRGYAEGNVQWVHKDINKMKMEFSTEKLFEYCKLICQHQNLL